MSICIKLEEKIKKYADKNRIQLIEQMSWRDRTVTYKIEDYEKNRFSLVVISLDRNMTEVKKKIYDLYNESKTADCLIKCVNISTEEDNDYCYIYIVTEEINQLMDLILEDKIDFSHKTECEKKIYFYEIIDDIGKNVQFIKRKIPEYSIYIDTEEIFIDKNGKGKLLLFNLAGNEISISYEAHQIVTAVRHMASGTGMEIKFDLREENLNVLLNDCKKNICMLEVENEKAGRIYNENIKKAMKGDKVSQFIIGCLYENGKGVPQNYKEAAKWYTESAKKKYTKGLNNLAGLYQKGLGVEKDILKAEKLLLESAYYGDSVACFNLGIMYQTGKKGKVDIKRAKKWYRESFNRGNEIAGKILEKIKEEDIQ